MNNKNYTVIHLHSDLSSGVTNIDSVTKCDDYINYASSLGMKAMGFSEHGSIFQWLLKKKHIEDLGMKYIHAEEFYLTEELYEYPDIPDEVYESMLGCSEEEAAEFQKEIETSRRKIRDNYHCLLIALNEEGFHELNTLSSIAFDSDHKYYVPRITFDELFATSDNILVSTACIGGVLNKGTDKAKEKFLNFLIKNKHRCYLEIQHHNVEDQIRYNRELYELSNKYDIPLVAMTDTHCLNETHVKGRKILQKAKNIYFEDEEGWDLTFKTYDELVEAYEKQNSLPMDVVLEAIENTNVIASKVEPFEVTNEYKYPHLWKNPEELFKKKVCEGAKKRGIYNFPNYKEYKKRVNYELKAYKHNGAIDFMLLMQDIIEWCNSQGIEVGYGRGSVNGSVIAYLMGITEMDSIKHNLNFERFMNTERVSLSDIDTDFPPSRREEVKDYIMSKDGLYCCDIITFNTIALKGAIRDVGRALEIDLDTVGKICNAVDSNETEMRKQYPELFEYVDLVNGTIVSVGSHPCGMVVSPHDVVPAFGTFRTATSKYPISQINMKMIDSLNYVKLDLLNLDTIELINDTCKLAGIDRLTPDNIDINDEKVWNSMRNDTTQIFQWEGNTGDNYIKKLLSDENIKSFQEANSNVDKMTLLSIGNSAIRPAGASYREDLARGVVRSSGSSAIDDFLKPTFGYLVFQCQIIEFLHKYCGFTMGEADIVRRHFAKKTGTDKDIPIIKDGGYMTDKKDHYIKGFVATMKEMYNMPKEEAEKTIVAFLQVIIDASLYLFSLNHSLPYSYEGYVSAWLRYYYPKEFITTALNINKDNEDKTLAITNYAHKVGINIKPIKFRYSQAQYSCDESGIYKGIASIKYLNETVPQELYALRDEHFDTFFDLLIRLKETSINSRQLDILVKLNFFSEFDKPNKLLKQIELFNNIYGKKQFSVSKLDELGIPMDIVKNHANKITEKTVKDFDSLKLLKDVAEHTEYKDTTAIDLIEYELDILGYTSVFDKDYSKNNYLVMGVKGKRKIELSLYEIYSGKTRTVYLWSNDDRTKFLSCGCEIKINKLKKENKRRPGSEINPKTGKAVWVPVEGEYEYWLGSWAIVGGQDDKTI